MMRQTAIIWALPALVALGCSGEPARVPAPAFDPPALAAEAMNRYDTNKNGKLDAAELAASPGLASALATVDSDRDLAISADELTQRFAKFRASKTALQTIQALVSRAGGPVSGAVVTLTPDPFQGALLKPAKGTTDVSGRTQFQIDGMRYAGVAPGYYTVSISLVDARGKEQAPASWNAKSSHGIEVGPGTEPIRDFNLSK